VDSTSHVIHVAPADQPGSVHQVAERLFSAYTVDGGNVHLAGCTLEDRLFLRLDFRHSQQHHSQESVNVYLDAHGEEVDGKLVEELGLSTVAELERPPRPFEPEIEQLVEAGIQVAARRFPSDGPGELVATTVLWCKFAEGKLRFAVGEDTTDLPFAGWSRTLRPPPFVCPHTAVSTFHLAATTDGRIVAAEQIEICAETERRVLSSDLVTCLVTGRRVVQDLIETCPVSGDRVLRTEMVECSMCRQRVSPPAARRGRCAACRGLQPVTKADPRMARLLDEHPPLDRWRNWRISETATAYVLTATGWFKRLLVVVDKELLDLKLLATGSRAFSRWHVAEPSQYEYVMRE